MHPVRRAKPDAFSSRVLSVVRRIPPGRVATYGEVAALAGRPRAARAVGNIRSLLAAEGVIVSGSRIRELDRVRWPSTRRHTPRTS